MATFPTSLRQQLSQVVAAARNMDRRTLLLSAGGAIGAITLVSLILPSSPTHVTKVVSNAQNVLAAPRSPAETRTTSTIASAPNSPQLGASPTTSAPHSSALSENPHPDSGSVDPGETPLPTIALPTAPSVPTAVPTAPTSPRSSGSTGGSVHAPGEVGVPAATSTTTPPATSPETTRAPSIPSPTSQNWTSIQTSPGDPTIGIEINPFAARGQFYVSSTTVQIDGEPVTPFAIRTPPAAACSSTSASRAGVLQLTSFTKSPGTYRVTANVTLTSCSDSSTHSVIETHLVQVFFPT